MEEFIRVPYGSTVHGDEEISAVVEVLNTTTQMSKNVLEFEDKIENWDGSLDNCSITLVSGDQFVFVNYVEEQYAYHSVKGFGFN